jgi:hypothetical protein
VLPDDLTAGLGELKRTIERHRSSPAMRRLTPMFGFVVAISPVTGYVDADNRQFTVIYRHHGDGSACRLYDDQFRCWDQILMRAFLGRPRRSPVG